MPILTVIQLVGKHWQLVAGLVLAAASFGYGYSMASDKCQREQQQAIESFQKQANEQSKSFEEERNKIDKTRRKVFHAKSSNSSCIASSDRVQRINAALLNDASKLN